MPVASAAGGGLALGCGLGSTFASRGWVSFSIFSFGGSTFCGGGGGGFCAGGGGGTVMLTTLSALRGGGALGPGLGTK